MQHDAAGGWEIEGDDFGGRMVRHLHPDEAALAYVYPDRDGDWAECSRCGAVLLLPDSSHMERVATA